MCVILLSPFPVVLWLKIISQSGHCLRMGKERTRERELVLPTVFLCLLRSPSCVWLLVSDCVFKSSYTTGFSQIQWARSKLSPNPVCILKKCACHAQVEVMMIHLKQNDLSDPGGAEAQSQSAALCWNQTSFCAEYWTLVWFWDWDPAWHHVMGLSLITRPQREVNLKRGLVGKKLHTATLRYRDFILSIISTLDVLPIFYFFRRLYSLHLKKCIINVYMILAFIHCCLKFWVTKFILQGCIKLIKSDSEENIYFSNKCCLFEMEMQNKNMKQHSCFQHW